MMRFRYNRLLCLAIVVGLVASLIINVRRHEVERQNMTVDFAIDYEALLELAEQEGLPPAKVLADAKEAGFTSLAVYERTFKKMNLSGKATAVPGAKILERYESGALASAEWRAMVERGEIVGTEVYVTSHDPLTYHEVKEDLIRRLGKDRVRAFVADGREALAVKAQYKSFEKMHLGMPTDEMRAVNEAGFHVIARPTNYVKATPEDVAAMFRRLDGIRVSEIVYSDKQVLGAPDALAATAEECKKRNLTMGLIEAPTQLQFYKQEGLVELAKLMDYRAARLYSIAKDEMEKISTPAAVERWVNTDEERNIRIDLLRLFEKPRVGKTLYETNMEYFRQTHEALAAHGFSFGPATWFEPFEPSRALRALVMVGVAAAGVLYLSLVLPWLNRRPKIELMLFAAGALVMAVPVLMGHGGKIRLLASLASANLFPSIAMLWILDRIRDKEPDASWSLLRLIGAAALALWVTGVLSFIGAAYLSGSLSDVEYFLEVNIFRGIKLTFVAPLIMVAIGFLQRFDLDGWTLAEGEGTIEQLRRLMDRKITVRMLAALFVALIAGVVFIARSGHNMGMPVSGLELRFRAFLEQAMYARPRSKELLIGHPAFMLAAFAWARKWPAMVFFALVMVATIGQGSMVETFAHMRTPVMMSFARGIGGIVLGAGIGAVLMVVAEVFHSYFQKEIQSKA
ncbi:MAG: hypothetical protein J5477_06710 [Schwartzia sp.]|nr:hypothetical protein [Schwartzia sp. (in: firmicutes)]